MIKSVSVAILCFIFINCSSAENPGQKANSTLDLIRNARGGQFLQNYYYPYQYTNWYYLYPSYTFTSSQCNSFFQCPTQCPGQCGVWGGLHACKCNSCPLVGQVCNSVNIQSGLYLHPYTHDNTKYVQCDTTPGVIYIRSCPTGLVYDSKFGVCNYPTQAYQTYSLVWGK